MYETINLFPTTILKFNSYTNLIGTYDIDNVNLNDIDNLYPAGGTDYNCLITYVKYNRFCLIAINFFPL